MSQAYAPYSGYCVGAALLCADGSVYTGCNIENAGYSATNCAERTAFFKAISDGKREFTAIAICGGKGGQLTDRIVSPCGVCRQVMREFCDDAFFVHLVTDTAIQTMTLAELLPLSFGPDNLTV
ncbi:MAG: cytidine deaminase [Clostridia bacterium]|nr:cytidine deaminase [Clostridia bacterium]